MTEPIENVNEKSAENHKVNQKKTSWGYLLAMILTVVLAGISYWLGQASKSVPPLTYKFRNTAVTSESGSVKEKFRQKVLDEELRYQHKNNEIMDDFEFKLKEIINRNFDTAENEIPSVIHDLSGLGACNKLCYKMVKDKIKHTDDAQKAIGNSLDKVLKHCKNGAAEVDELLKNCEVRLAENSNEFRSAIAAALKSPEYADLDISLIEQQTNEMVQNRVYYTAQSTILAEISVALEIVFIRSTYRIISTVFAKAVGKMVGSSSVSLILAAADGPLPIGDTVAAGIAIVGLGWTAYDIHEARKVLPGKLEAELRKAVQEYRNGVTEKAKGQAQHMFEEYRNSTKELVENVF